VSTKAVATIPDSAVYMSPGGEIQLDVPLDSNTVWLTQNQMARLFGSSQRMMSYHIKNVFLDNELDRKSNTQKMYIAGSDKPVSLHSLDVIISVDYRVKCTEGVHFRRWATTILRERLLKAHRQRQTEHDRLETLRKRIGSLLFVHYLEKNDRLSHADGSHRFDANALVAIALLVAESAPKQKDVVLRLILAMLSS
jgi:hypothetical protein